MSIINVINVIKLLMYMNIKYYILLVFIYKFMSIKDKKKKEINTNFIIKLFYLFKNHNQFIYPINKNHGEKNFIIFFLTILVLLVYDLYLYFHYFVYKFVFHYSWKYSNVCRIVR